MDSRLLTFLETLESSTTFSEAAQKLYLSQPYLSRIIKKYEKQYNVTLINRNSHPVQLTPAGHLLITYLRKDLQLQNELTNKMRKYEQSSFPTLRMGITPPLGENFNLTILPILLEKFPNLKTSTLELSTADAEKAFKDEQLDLFVGNIIQLPGIKSQSLHKDTQVLVLGRNSKLYQPRQKEIPFSLNKLHELIQENFIIVDGERHYQEIINNYFNKIGLHFYPQIHVRDSLTALKLASKGLGNMTTSIEMVKNDRFSNINYIVLPVNEINVNFAVSTDTANIQLAEEINEVSKILNRTFTSKILTY